jgi:hypothetical protein
LNKLEKGPLSDYETAFCSVLALAVLEKKIFKDLASFRGFSLPGPPKVHSCQKLAP